MAAVEKFLRWGNYVLSLNVRNLPMIFRQFAETTKMMGKAKETATAYKPARRAQLRAKPRNAVGESKIWWSAFLRQGWEGWKEKEAAPLDLVRLVEGGVSLDAIDVALEEGIITREELHDVVLPVRTLSHRKEKGQSLTPDESDKLLRLLRIKAMAFDTFQNRDKATGWLHEPSMVLKGEVPIELVKTEHGARLVEDELHRIGWGLFV